MIMNIVCCPDKAYVSHTGIMLKSLLLNNPAQKFCIHVVVDSDVSETQKEQLRHIVVDEHGSEIVFYDANSIELSEFPNVNFNHVTRATYYRLFLADMLPADLSRVLYLDGDIIVRSNIAELYNTDISQYAIGAVIEQETDNIQHYNRLQYPHALGYFNAGVLLINLEYWRKHNLKAEFLAFIEEHADRILYHDQDVLNYVLRERKFALPLKYNVQTHFFKPWTEQHLDRTTYEGELEQAINDPVILHFTTSSKPWQKSSTHPMKGEYLKYKAMTIWKDAPLQKTLNPYLRGIGYNLLKLLKLR